MSNLAAFVGHSFIENDKEVVEKFLGFFDRISHLNPWFTWDHAKPAEPKILSKKVLEKMENKNLLIAICTAKEFAIMPEMVKKCILDKKYLKILKNNIKLKTSDWIIQEIGLAVGRGINIMLLLEDGVRLPGGLQGDLNYINFNRAEPEKAHNEILEMLISLRPKVITTGIGVEKPIEQEPIKEEDVKEKSEESRPSDDWGYWDYRFALFENILGNNKEKEKEIYDKYLETEAGKDEYNKIKWEVDRLYLLNFYKKEDNMEEIIRIYKEHPTHSYVNSRLATLYENLEEFEKAATFFENAAINSKSDRENFHNLCNAAKSWAKNENINEMILSLNKAKDLKDMIDDGESSILKIMADIYAILNDNENCLAFMEGFIDEKPYDHNTRFSLAYKYSQVNEHDLSLYHYKILVDQRQDKIDWNNIGWARENLKLPGKAIASYRASEKLGETLAMSNIAYSLIYSGFFDEARQLCIKAKEISDYNERIDSGLAKISELKIEEDKKEKEVINNTKPIRSFYIDYAHACSKKLLDGFSSKFKGPDCDLDISIKNNIFEAKGSFERTSYSGSWASAFGFRYPGSALVSGTQAPIEKTITMVVEYTGEVIGRGIKYKLRINEKGSIPTLLGDNPDRGLMIIMDELSEIKVYQKGSRGNEKFYSLLRIE